jgi:hypothetical protein
MNTKINNILIIFQSIALFLFNPIVYAQGKSKSIIKKEDDIQEESVSRSAYEEKLKRWQSLSEEEREAIREKARKLSPEQIKKLQKKFVEFRKLSKEEQDRIRANYQIFKGLSSKEKEVLRQRYEYFQKLPLEKRRELRHKFKKRKITSPAAPSKGLRPSAVPLRKGRKSYFKKEGTLVVPRPSRLPKRRGPVFPGLKVDRREDIRDRREDLRDRREDIEDRRRDIDIRDRDPGPGRDRGLHRPSLEKGLEQWHKEGKGLDSKIGPNGKHRMKPSPKHRFRSGSSGRLGGPKRTSRPGRRR